MKWTLTLSDKAVKQLKKLDKQTSRLIIAWLRKNVDGCEDPRAHGKGLVGDKAGIWRYRIGDYRVLCELNDGDLVVLALEVAHRKSVYR